MKAPWPPHPSDHFPMSTTAWDEFLRSKSDDVTARPPHRLPSIGDGASVPTQLVHLHHPGYPSPNQSTLFTLPTCSINTEKLPCAEYSLAWQGCYALAIERGGFFTLEAQRNSTRVEIGKGLLAGHYWYHLHDDDGHEPYVTLQSFQSWQYTDVKMPEGWFHAIPVAGEQGDDQSNGDCCITGEDYAQQARIVPKTERDWWTENNMFDYASGSGSSIGQAMEVSGNFIPLSDGLHRLWDDDFFCLFPLIDSNKRWRLHCLFTRPLRKMVRIHHRRPLRSNLQGASAACCWARFVLLICRKYERAFLSRRVRRKLGGSETPARWVEAEEISKQIEAWRRDTVQESESRGRKRIRSS